MNAVPTEPQRRRLNFLDTIFQVSRDHDKCRWTQKTSSAFILKSNIKSIRIRDIFQSFKFPADRVVKIRVIRRMPEKKRIVRRRNIFNKRRRAEEDDVEGEEEEEREENAEEK